MTSCSKMFDKRTWFSSDIYLNRFDSAFDLVGYGDVVDALSAEERESADGAVFFQAFYPDVIAGEIHNS